MHLCKIQLYAYFSKLSHLKGLFAKCHGWCGNIRKIRIKHHNLNQTFLQTKIIVCKFVISLWIYNVAEIKYCSFDVKEQKKWTNQKHLIKLVNMSYYSIKYNTTLKILAYLVTKMWFYWLLRCVLPLCSIYRNSTMGHNRILMVKFGLNRPNVMSEEDICKIYRNNTLLVFFQKMCPNRFVWKCNWKLLECHCGVQINFCTNSGRGAYGVQTLETQILT
jgi:hypothetical protein